MEGRPHPNQMDRAELASLLQNVVGLLYHLRDFLQAAQRLAGAEREQALAAARQHAYDVVYVEQIPDDALARKGATSYDLPDFSERSAEELRELLWSTSWLALDLAQHLDFSTRHLRPEYRTAAYARAAAMAQELADYPLADVRDLKVNPGVAVFGGEGLDGWTA